MHMLKVSTLHSVTSFKALVRYLNGLDYYNLQILLGLQWDVANVDRNKLMKFELILSIRGEITKDHLPGGVDLTPPHVE